ncbi:gas vesicle protein GvpM [Haloterrigena alkaliphila]|uniref:Gas vesicle protein n=1 Tax=Haloterrigena alkaliphila TaxID=2816475 RepID=A0A8A2VF11_9EURY|nr:gas vesicle protein [Haloterrigena alkaliphila]QSW99300.1 gas vesicle protein [Haloterrigena alkaliphila]
MRPRKDEETLVDVLDVLLRDGAVLRADVIVSVADIPLVGIKLTAAIAGMETMTEYGLFEEWDVERRRSALSRRQHQRDRSEPPDELERITVGTSHDGALAQEDDEDRDDNEE